MSNYRPPTAERSSPEREAELAHLAQRGCQESAERLYREASHWLMQLATSFSRRSGLDREEAIAVANLAFFQVLPKFDPSRSRMTTFLSLTVPQRLQQATLRERLVRAPSTYKGEASSSHEQLQKTEKIASLSATNGEPTGLSSRLVSSLPDSADAADALIESERVRKALDQMQPAYRDVLRLLFFEQLTLDAAGVRLGLTRERVRQIKGKAIESLRRRYEALFDS